jgi:hypothetical protein
MCLMFLWILKIQNYRIDLQIQKSLTIQYYLTILMSHPSLKIQNYQMNLQFQNFHPIR